MDIHVLYSLRRQPCQDSSYPAYQIGRKLPVIVFLKIPLHSPMLKTADHLSTVACNATYVTNSWSALPDTLRMLLSKYKELVCHPYDFTTSCPQELAGIQIFFCIWSLNFFTKCFLLFHF